MCRSSESMPRVAWWWICMVSVSLLAPEVCLAHGTEYYVVGRTSQEDLFWLQVASWVIRVVGVVGLFFGPIALHKHLPERFCRAKWLLVGAVVAAALLSIYCAELLSLAGATEVSRMSGPAPNLRGGLITMGAGVASLLSAVAAVFLALWSSPRERVWSATAAIVALLSGYVTALGWLCGSVRSAAMDVVQHTHSMF